MDSAVNRLIASWNRGKGRILYKGVVNRGIRVHSSVRTRMKETGYLPKIRFTVGDEVRCLTKDEWSASDPKHFKWVD